MKKQLISISAIITGICLFAMPIANTSAVTIDDSESLDVAKDVSVEVEVGSIINLTLDGTTKFVNRAGSTSNTISPGDFATATSAVNVWTNYWHGYELTVATAGTETGHESDLVSGTNYITPNASPTTGNLASGAGGWYISSETGVSGSTDAHFPYVSVSPFAPSTTPTSLVKRDINLKSEAGETTTVTYSVQTAVDQPSGTYVGKVLYTAAINVLDGSGSGGSGGSGA
ncbi:MAG: hypothetical protein Q4E47_03215 [Candidatus Saccharibacteria bacterium]|nr:hypothetical protein [Candidatus Saccharibacteria bacterium]